MNRHRIMIVDDDADLRAVIAGLLRDHYEIVEAIDGLDALNKLETHEPDFAVLDVEMPLMDGFQLCRAIRKHARFRGVPVLFLSAYGSKENIRKGYEAGANLFMVKPIEPSRVLKNVQFTIEHERVEIRPKRHAIQRLRQMDEEARNRPPEPPAATEPDPASEPAGSKVREAPEMPEGRGEAPRAATPAASDTPPPRDPSRLRLQPSRGPVESPRPEPARPAPVRPEPPRPEPAPPPPPESAPEEPRRMKLGPARPAPPPDPAPGAPRPRAMLVDNDEDMLRLLDLAVRGDFETVFARDGMDAVEKLVDYQPDLLLIDVMMPRMNGYQLLQSIRRNASFRHLPVFIITGRATDRDRDYALRMGANGFIAKPFSPEDLLRAMKREVSAPGFGIAAKRMRLEEIRAREAERAPLAVEEEI